MDEAKMLYDEAVGLQHKYKQEDNEEISQAISSLKVKMDDRICVNLSNDCFTLTKKTENRINAKKYIEAKRFADSALSMIKNHPDCQVDDEPLLQLQNQFADAFTYVEIEHNMFLSIEDEEYENAVSEFSTLIEKYESLQIKRFGIEMPDLLIVLRNNKNSSFSKTACSYFIKNGQFAHAWECLLILKQLKVPSKEVKGLQVSTASGIAKKDKANGEDLKSKVREYTNDDKWFRYFRSEYLKHQ
jgi:hypothetical protein